MELKPATGPQIVYDGEVTREDLGIWNSELEGLFARISSFAVLRRRGTLDCGIIERMGL